MAEKMALERAELSVLGLVQGVGFRPHIYRLAKRLNLTGFVQNTPSGVFIEIQGVFIAEFIRQLNTNLPALAKINRIKTKKIPLKTDENQFEIKTSASGCSNTIIAPDTCICSACLQELFDPSSRYFQYPFLNCTHCGPRFTITRNLPYDRCQTAMESFPLCADCEMEYNNPENRRYHAQPTACKHCGPQLSLPVVKIAEYLLQGKILAIKGLGGYQLLCDAQNETTLTTLRLVKNREAKPFALMAANTASVESIAVVNEASKLLLESAKRPIVLLQKKERTLPDCIAPGLNHLGIMLPSTPLHYLLFHYFAGSPKDYAWMEAIQTMILVVTSANLGGEPLIIDDTIVLEIPAHTHVAYNRPIIARVDDSVSRIIQNTPLFIRRSRGFVPTPIPLPHAIPPTLGVGGHLKNTFCITRGDEAFVSQQIGSLTNKATIEFFHESLNHLLKFLNVKPERIAHDLHPDFYTTRFAENYGIPSFPIQHHHAHLAAVAVEHLIQKPILGLALDGYGYGLHGEAWGGELLRLTHASFERLGCLYPLAQPGGEMASREPWRMAASVLHELGKGNEIAMRFKGQTQAPFIHYLLSKRINSPLTSSCGRLFDAASALLNIRILSQYEGQAAMQLESLVSNPQILPNGWQIKNNRLSVLPMLEVLSTVRDPILGANLFHGTFIAALADWITGISRENEMDMIVLGGGCFLNKIISEGLINALNKHHITALLPRHLPPNDGGISLGQAWIAGIKDDLCV